MSPQALLARRVALWSLAAMILLLSANIFGITRLELQSRAVLWAISTLPLLGRLAEGCLQKSPHNQPLIYKVQIIASMNAATAPLLAEDPAAMVEVGPGGILRYTVGAEPTFAAARTRQQQLEVSGYGGAYIVPYVYGERLDRTRARLLSSQFPDLQQYLQQP